MKRALFASLFILLFSLYSQAFAAAPATVNITITPVNDAPAADSKSVATSEDQSVSIALTGSDVDGDILIFTVVSAPQHGTFANGGTVSTRPPRIILAPTASRIGPATGNSTARRRQSALPSMR